MTYELVLKEAPSPDVHKDYSENIVFRDLPKYYKVFILYYSPRNRNLELENELKSLGFREGTNLLVNVGFKSDPDYSIIASKFGIETRPAIIVTGIDQIASSENTFSTAYARIDKEYLFKDSKKIVDIVDTLYNMFISGKISEAIKYAQKQERNTILIRIKDTIYKAFEKLAKFLENRDIIFEVASCKIELRRSEGRS